MAIRRINIEVWDDKVSLADAVRLVAAVIDRGRVSRESFCYATTFKKPRTAVEAQANKLDPHSKRVSSDSFRIVPITQPDLPFPEKPPQLTISEVYGDITV